MKTQYHKIIIFYFSYVDAEKNQCHKNFDLKNIKLSINVIKYKQLF